MVARGHELHVERVTLPGEDGRRGAADEHDPAFLRDLLHHTLGDPHQVGLGELVDGPARLGRDHQLRRRRHDGPGEPLDEGRHPLLPLGDIPRGQPRAGRDPLHQLVVDHAPAEPLGHSGRGRRPAGAVLAGDGDEHGAIAMERAERRT